MSQQLWQSLFHVTSQGMLITRAQQGTFRPNRMIPPFLLQKLGGVVGRC